MIKLNGNIPRETGWEGNVDEMIVAAIVCQAGLCPR